jgi:DNA polymerase
MAVMSCDIETYSSVDLKKCGVYRYVEADDFEILLFAYAFDDGPVKIVDLAQGQVLPVDVREALTNPEVIKAAFNAAFERVCIAKYFGIATPPSQWRCTQVHALTLGLPGHLKGVAKALKLEQQKDAKGTNLIRYFSMPCKPTKANGGRTRNYPNHDLLKWHEFKDYCVQDVEVERAIRKKLSRYPMTEQKLWELDQMVNDRGIQLDSLVVKHAIQCATAYQEKLEEEARELTGLENPNSLVQLKEWFTEQGLQVERLTKKDIPELLKTAKGPTKRMLAIRQELSKTSVKKYQAMERVICQDQRSRGLLQFYGASRTGRWAGRLIQVHNLPRNYLSDLDLARQLLREGCYEEIELFYDSVPDVLSQLIRTTFIPSPGCRFLVSDFSAIEARVIAWLAGEQWRLDVFKDHGKIYEASASQMFGVPLEEITKDSPLRQKGKVAELALGYQGSVGALKQMGALDMGLSEEELPELVSRWRSANPRIVELWRDVEAAALGAVREGAPIPLQHGLVFSVEKGILFIRLPSGRRLAYARPKIEVDERFGKECLTYESDQTREKTYGGKLVENIVQSIARDCLAEAMLRLDQAGYRIAFHVHDEIVADQAHGSVEEMSAIMARPVSWAPGLPLAAEGFEADYYTKG